VELRLEAAIAAAALGQTDGLSLNTTHRYRQTDTDILTYTVFHKKKTSP